MYEIELRITKKHRKAARAIAQKVISEIKPKYIVTITGENRTGKAATAHALGVKLRKEGIKAKVIHMANYYKLSGKEREIERLETNFTKVGPNELDWDKLNQNIADFKEGKKSIFPLRDGINYQIDLLQVDFQEIEVLIINGLYALYIDEADLKVYIESTYEETIDEEPIPIGEQPDDVKKMVWIKEHAYVREQKNRANFFVDYTTNYEDYHL